MSCFCVFVMKNSDCSMNIFSCCWFQLPRAVTNLIDRITVVPTVVSHAYPFATPFQSCILNISKMFVKFLPLLNIFSRTLECPGVYLKWGSAEIVDSNIKCITMTGHPERLRLNLWGLLITSICRWHMFLKLKWHRIHRN